MDKLFKREIKGDSIKVSPYPRLLAEFAKDPVNSRSVPGKETISISYKVRAPKFLLIKPRISILKEFKERNPECKFSLSVLNREWPQNVVTPTSRDMDRNICPIHSNARRIEVVLKKYELIQDVPASCCLMSSLIICQKETVTPLDPLTWGYKCVMGDCDNCPKYKTIVLLNRRQLK